VLFPTLGAPQHREVDGPAFLIRFQQKGPREASPPPRPSDRPPRAVLGADRKDVETGGMELAQVQPFLPPISSRPCSRPGTPASRPAAEAAPAPIGSGEALHRVDHQDDGVRFTDGSFRLLADRADELLVRLHRETAGVHTRNRFAPCCASAYCRSRVTPGTSSTMARRLPTIRLNSVDFPTLGRPTSATSGSTTQTPRQAPLGRLLAPRRLVDGLDLRTAKRDQAGAVDAHAHQVPDRSIALEVHGPVLTRAAESGLFDEDLDGPADPVTVAPQGARHLQRLHLFQSADGGRPRDLAHSPSLSMAPVCGRGL